MRTAIFLSALVLADAIRKERGKDGLQEGECVAIIIALAFFVVMDMFELVLA